jgi:hypothetical protein
MNKLTLALTATLGVLGGCWLNCTEMGCIGSVVVQASGATPEAAIWTVALSLDDREFGCEGPAEPNGDTGAPTMTLGCPDGVLLTLEDGLVTVALEVAEDEAAAVVRTVVSADGVVVFDDSFEPAWEEYAPNGEQCGPVCRGTSRDVAF